MHSVVSVHLDCIVPWRMAFVIDARSHAADECRSKQQRPSN
jgi:hypothetical protein